MGNVEREKRRGDGVGAVRIGSHLIVLVQYSVCTEFELFIGHIRESPSTSTADMGVGVYEDMCMHTLHLGYLVCTPYGILRGQWPNRVR